MNTSATENLFNNSLLALNIYKDSYNSIKEFVSKYDSLGLTIPDAWISPNGCTGLELKAAVANLKTFLTNSEAGVLTNIFKVLG